MKEWIRQEIIDGVAEYRKNPNIATTWKQPLVGYAHAQDDLFPRLKEAVSPAHSTPREILPSAQSVIAYFLPFEERIAESNRNGQYPSQQWKAAYVETNQLIAAINQRLAQVLEERGYQCAVIPPTHNFDKERLMSGWSHKHVGYIAGLGKFGLHQMLITEQGCCGRLGSLITSAPIEATPLREEEFCLYKHNQSCRVCVTRCTSKALTETGFDRRKCYDVLRQTPKSDSETITADVCGKCVSMVPCSFTNPVVL